eukprot:m.170908 g.170908  ORF g.170908 m.170908 type:complete len:781 (+) comp16491_c0_seq1:88-2430(+)
MATTGREMYVASLRSRRSAGPSAVSPFLRSLVDEVTRDPNVQPAFSSRRSSATSTGTTSTVHRLYGEASGHKGGGSAGSRRKQRPSARGKASISRDEELASADAADQIYELKKEIRAWQTENNVLKAEVNTLKVKYARKERELQDILEEAVQDPSSATLRPKATNMHFISRLKAKVADAEHEAEQLRAELDTTHAKLKFTRIEELELEVTTYYNETLRLRALLNEGVHLSSHDETTSKEAGKHHATGYLPPSAAELKKLQEKCTFLEAEVETLQLELDKTKAEFGPSNQAEKADEFDSMSRQQLLTEIRSLADDFKQLQQQHHKLQNDHDEAVKAQETNTKETKRLRKKLDRTEHDLELATEKVQLLEQTNQAILQQLSAATQFKPDLFRENFQPLLDAHASSLQRRLEQLDALEPLFKSHSEALAAKMEQLEEQTKAAREVQEKHAEALKIIPAELTAKAEEDQQRTDAARSLQRHWRQRRARHELKKEDKDEKIAKLQAVFRGHAARKRLMKELEERSWRRVQGESDSDDEAIMHSESSLGPSQRKNMERRKTRESGSSGMQKRTFGKSKDTVVGKQQRRRTSRKDQVLNDENNHSDEDDDNQNAAVDSRGEEDTDDEEEEEEAEEDEEEEEDQDEGDGRGKTRKDTTRKQKTSRNDSSSANHIRPNRPPTREKPAQPHHRFQGRNSRVSSAQSNIGHEDTRPTSSGSTRSSEPRQPKLSRTITPLQQQPSQKQATERVRTSLQSELGVNSSVDATTDDEISDSEHPGLALPIEDELF